MKVGTKLFHIIFIIINNSCFCYYYYQKCYLEKKKRGQGKAATSGFTNNVYMFICMLSLY